MALRESLPPWKSELGERLRRGAHVDARDGVGRRRGRGCHGLGLGLWLLLLAGVLWLRLLLHLAGVLAASEPLEELLRVLERLRCPRPA